MQPFTVADSLRISIQIAEQLKESTDPDMFACNIIDSYEQITNSLERVLAILNSELASVERHLQWKNTKPS